MVVTNHTTIPRILQVVEEFARFSIHRFAMTIFGHRMVPPNDVCWYL